MKYKTSKLRQGYVVVSEDYIVVEQTKTETSNYVGVVAEKNNSIPNYLIFSAKAINEYSADDEDRLYSLLEELYPEIKAVRQAETVSVFDDKGQMVNVAEWKAAPRLGLFPVPEVMRLEDLKNGNRNHKRSSLWSTMFLKINLRKL